MSARSRILLQTTIPPTEDDWHIGRFALLRDHLGSLRGEDGEALFDVVARDRTLPGAPDPVLSTIDTSDFDQLWLFAVDVGDGLTTEDCAAIGRFRARGGGLMLTRDHMDLGSSICALGGVGLAHYFHSRQLDPDLARHAIDDRVTSSISWPNYHSGANGDYQEIRPEAPAHPLLADPQADDGVLRLLPAHPHEGGVGVPPGDSTARVIATGTSKVSGTRFNIAVAFEPAAGNGPALAESTFHHFADYNWDPAQGCPSFVSEPPGDGVARSPEAQRMIRLYAVNIALWLSGRPTGRGTTAT
jgi:hypothetical protein